MNPRARPLGRVVEQLNLNLAAAAIVTRRARWAISNLPLVVLPGLLGSIAAAQPVAHVIHISVDGLRSDAIIALGPTNLPNFYRLRAEGAFTDNARTDYDYTETVQDHACQLTGRAVLGLDGHNWTNDVDPDPGQTLASSKGSYVAGVFDVAHDHGLRTGLYASKSKFSLFSTSWDSFNGAPDVIEPDNGKGKVDVFLYRSDTLELENAMIADMVVQPFHYVFLHLLDPDIAGHTWGWDVTSAASGYSAAVKTIDSRLGRLLNLMDTDPQFHGHTAIVLTTDHGGDGIDHGNATLASEYTIPFYVWGPGVMAGADLYLLNPANRLNPGTGRPTYSEPVPPIRNGEAANVALKLLGLGPVPGSTINAAQDLALAVPPPTDVHLAVTGDEVSLSFSMRTNVLYDVQHTSNSSPGGWSDVATNLAGTEASVTRLVVGTTAEALQFYRLKLHF
jgi:hypothetical protein